MPLWFKVAYKSVDFSSNRLFSNYYYARYPESIPRPSYCEFNDFISFFNREGVEVVRAQTFNREGKLVARSFIYGLDFIGEGEDKKEIIKILEIHYNPKNSKEEAIFICISEINEKGFKINQKVEKGKKQKEYYYVWPVSFLTFYKYHEKAQ